MTSTSGQMMTSQAAAISSHEEQGLLNIWEEEKAARDLYASLYEKNNLTIFMDLMKSEQRHMDQAKAILDKYGLIIPERGTW